MSAARENSGAETGTLPPLTLDAPDSGPVIARLNPGWGVTNPARLLEPPAMVMGTEKRGRSLVFEDKGLDRTDAVTVSAILDWIHEAEGAGFTVDDSTLPGSIRRLVRLAREVPARGETPPQHENRVIQIGRKAVMAVRTWNRFVEFLGELVIGLGKVCIGRVRFRTRDFWVILQDVSVSALPIVSLLSLLTGMILGFVGAVQLRKFGATIYMTDLVGLAMARELGCIMTGVIMSGRTGAAFAAHIGNMKVNQEIDALETLGLSPVDFLVVPRTIALVVMMPVLTLWANVLGWFGGFLVALPMDISVAEYWIQLTESTALKHTVFGVSKAFFFGIVVATTGCYYGLRSGRNSAAVGTAATRAVVAGITWIIILDALFAIMDEVLQW